VLSVIQAAFTDLMFDEAYYWKYQTQLAWGYFDHPPMIAWLIKPGYWIFGNTLGVRFSIVILTLLLIYLLEKLIKPKNLKLFYVLISSVMIFHFIGFLALPDLPLLFFTVTFFIAYKSYLSNDSFKNSLLLALAIALLLYSKYHGILVVLFTVLSNVKILKKKSFWMVTTFSLILFLPHILWQYQNDWVSLRFHLVERRYNDYLPVYTLEYLVSQPFIFGPLVGFPLIWFFIKSSAENNFKKALKFTGVGFFIFFFISSFKGHVEANWTIPVLIPLLILGYDGIEKSNKTKQYIFKVFPITLLLILAIRIYLIYDFLPEKWNVKTDFHGWRSWANSIKNHTVGKTVFFANSYQKASVYEFYSGNPSFSLNNIWGRRNQYSLWDITKTKGWENEVALAHNFPVFKDDSLITETETVFFYNQPNFIVLPFIKISPLQKEFRVQSGENISVNFNITKMGHTNILIDRLETKSLISYEIYAHDQVLINKTTHLILTDSLLENGTGVLSIIAPKQPDTYYFSLSVSTDALPPTINSYKYKLVVE
jgi:hypothetical protein